ncbi:hypothetical protein BGX23_000918 [Mortierella sp. AD031]|nr:hypothetical protein BGX23_000918 [Mortierella sp. AD031]
MLWRKAYSMKSNPYEPKSDSETKGIFFWLYALSIQKVAVECNDFDLKTLDNPAITALVEYKCVSFYVLVLIRVFMQIEHSDGKQDMAGVFITIAATSSLFLWIELNQMLKDNQRYIASICNAIDLLAFVLPLVNSLQELLWASADGHSSWLSFSVLFIFLHFLFELRVIRSVCHFVSIIIQAIASIRLFIIRIDPSYTEGFSLNLLRGLSMAYFMMGGRYDLVSNGFSANNASFHAIMVVFFFTVIVMLNALIGSGALMVLMKQFQEDRNRRDEKQKRRDQEWTIRDEELRSRDEERARMIAELKNEVLALKSQLQQQVYE